MCIVSLYCAVATEQLIVELKARFPAQTVMDALRVVYPQYWLQQSSPEISFRKHLDVLKSFYGEAQWVRNDDNKCLIPTLLDRFELEVQQPLFKMAMISNATTAMDSLGKVNPLTRLWRMLDANNALAKSMSEYVKLAEIAMIHVLGSVEDERCFSSLSFLKDQLRNRLSDGNLSLVVGMHSQNVYTLETFPYDECFLQWVNSTEHGQYGLTG